MRLTVDIDSKELLPRLRASLGFMFFGPAEIRETKRGYHYIWHDIKIDPKRLLSMRKLLGDDPNRIRLDTISEKRIKQVLFKRKEIYYMRQGKWRKQ